MKVFDVESCRNDVRLDESNIVPRDSMLELMEDQCIPIEFLKKLPTLHKRTLGFGSALAMIAIFIGFTVQGYINSINQEYISLDTSEGICSTVPRPVTGKFLVSDDGYWEGTENFKYSHALLLVELNNFVVNQDEYEYNMNQLRIGLAYWANEPSTNQNLAWNLLLLMEQLKTMPTNNYLQVASYAADAADVFSTESLFMSMASKRQGSCSVYSFPDFYASDAALVGSFDKGELEAHCNETYPHLYSSSALNASSSLDIKMDMHSFSTASAINMGYADISIIEQVLFPEMLRSVFTFVHTPSGAEYQLMQFINPLHAHMTPIYCLFEVRGSDTVFLVCLVRQDYTFFLPLLNHIGGDLAHYYGIPQFCDCSSDVGHSSSCNSMDILAALLFLSKEFPDPLTFYHNLVPLITLLRRYNETYFDPLDPRAFYRRLTADAYEASVFTIRGSDSMTAINFQLDGAPSYSFNNVFDFCGIDCSMLAVRFYDFGNVAISEHSYNLLEGSCAPVIQLDHWDNIVKNPPVTLIESYYRCRQKKVIALYNAVGIAMGLESLFLSMLAFVLLVYVLLAFGFGKQPQQSSKLGAYETNPSKSNDAANGSSDGKSHGGHTLGLSLSSIDPKQLNILLKLAQDISAAQLEIAAGKPVNISDPVYAFAAQATEEQRVGHQNMASASNLEDI